MGSLHDLSSYRMHRNFEFHQVAHLIMEWRLLIGVMWASEVFRHLGPRDIYDHFQAPEEGVGLREGRDYLVMANSDGDGGEVLKAMHELHCIQLPSMLSHLEDVFFFFCMDT